MSTNLDNLVKNWMNNEKMSGYFEKSALAEELLNLAIAGKDKIKISSVINMIEGLPAADVAPVRHGRWTRIDYHDARCSECGHKTYYPDRISLYCPECGARMDGGADQ